MKQISIIAAMVFAAAAAQSSLLIDTNFSAMTGTDMATATDNVLYRNGAKDETGVGWRQGGMAASSSFADASNQLTLGPAANVFADNLSAFSMSFGQVNQDNSATKGNVSFSFTVDSTAGITGVDTIWMAVQVYRFTGTTEQANNRIFLNNSSVDSLWTLVGTATTANITNVGVYTTGNIDMGTGYDVVGIRIVPQDNGTADFGDTVTLSAISVNSAVPEPATFGVYIIGSLTSLLLRRMF